MCHCVYHSDPAQPESKENELENPAATELQPVATMLNLGLMVQRPAPPPISPAAPAETKTISFYPKKKFSQL